MSSRARLAAPVLLALTLYCCMLPSDGSMCARYEPPDGRVLHGLGQFVPEPFYTAGENRQYANEYQAAAQKVPVLFSAYQFADPRADALDTTDLAAIANYQAYPYIPVVGIYLLDTTHPDNPIPNPAAILSGQWDQTLRALAGRIKAIDGPVFVRPGFEFGAGTDGIHQGFSAADFVAIWRHIRAVFKREGVSNAAWIWNIVNPDKCADYMSYYPGDAAVDWWGINYFTSEQILRGDAFLLDAVTHNKPVMICESCPIHSGGTLNTANWTDWFVPYFNKIKQFGHIKAFIYISDPWDRPGFFDAWPDSRLNAHADIAMQYAGEMLDPRYIHMDEYISNNFWADTAADGIIDACEMADDSRGIPHGPVSMDWKWQYWSYRLQTQLPYRLLRSSFHDFFSREYFCRISPDNI